jgi:hypothetical protein
MIECDRRAAWFPLRRVTLFLSTTLVILSIACVSVAIPGVKEVVIKVEATSTPIELQQTPTPTLIIIIPTEEPIKTPRPTKTLTPTITPFYNFQDRPTRTPQPGQYTWRGDLHVHSGCTKKDYETVIKKALQFNFSFIAITDHFGFMILDCREVLQLCAAETRLFCIPGEELFDGQMEIIALGHQAFLNQQPDLVSEIAKIHEQNGLAIAAHPLVNSAGGIVPPIDEYSLYHSGFDAMECYRASASANQKQYGDSKRYHLPCVFVSDSHPPEHYIGGNFTICSAPINSLADLESALDQGLCWGYQQ